VVITQPAASLELLTRKQAAHLLGIGLKTLDRLVREGRLRHIKAGARILRFRPADIEYFLDESACNSTAKESD
jgi:excisionase family DNA binding protein